MFAVRRPIAAIATTCQRRAIGTIKSVYVADVTASGSGRVGKLKGSEGWVCEVAKPKALGGPGNTATAQNPEILMAGAYATCYFGALEHQAPVFKLKLPATTTVQAKVHLGPLVDREGFNLAVDLVVKAPGLDKKAVEQLCEAAHKICPFSNATKGNIALTTTVV